MVLQRKEIVLNLRRLAAVASEDAAVYAHVADIFMTLGMTSDAIKALQEGEKQRPNNPLLLTTHAQIMLEYFSLTSSLYCNRCNAVSLQGRSS